MKKSIKLIESIGAMVAAHDVSKDIESDSIMVIIPESGEKYPGTYLFRVVLP